MGGLAALDAVVVVGGLGEARGVVRVARVGGDLEDLVQGDEARVGEVVELRDVADSRGQLLRNDGQGVAGRDGVVDSGSRAAGRRWRRACAGARGSGLRAIRVLITS